MITNDGYIENIRHSSKTNEHYTPEWIVTGAHHTFGAAPDLDPFSCEIANRVVRATRYLTQSEDGFKASWRGVVDDPNVFVNPPGGKVESSRIGSQALAWGKACEELWLAHNTRACTVFVSFSVELLQTAQSDDMKKRFRDVLRHPLDFPTCFPAKRVQYDQEVVKMSGSARRPGRSPPHSSMIVCMSVDSAKRARFREYFSKFGYVTDGSRLVVAR